MSSGQIIDSMILYLSKLGSDYFSSAIIFKTKEQV